MTENYNNILSIAPLSQTLCRFWKPEDGRVFETDYAFDSETELISDEKPWQIPDFVIAGAYDGNQAFLLTRETLAEFLQFHDNLRIVMHNAPFDLAVIANTVNKDRFDIYGLVEKNRFVTR